VEKEGAERKEREPEVAVAVQEIKKTQNIFLRSEKTKRRKRRRKDIACGSFFVASIFSVSRGKEERDS